MDYKLGVFIFEIISTCSGQKQFALIMFFSPVCKVRTLLLLIYFSSNVMVPKLRVIHLRVAVPMKIELRLFRSKTVCSYNVLLSCLKVHTLLLPIYFSSNVMVPKLPVIHLGVAVPMKIELRLFRSKKFALIMFFSPVPKVQTDTPCFLGRCLLITFPVKFY